MVVESQGLVWLLKFHPLEKKVNIFCVEMAHLQTLPVECLGPEFLENSGQ